MSESGPAAQPPQEQEAPGQTASAPMTAGRLLADRREQVGMHLAALAATLKVPLQKLQALEADQYEQFKDIVFLRALASSVCRALKMDAAPVLALLPRSMPVALKDQQGLNARFNEAGARPDGAGALGLPISRLTALAVIGLLAAALVVAFVPRNETAVPDVAEFAVQPVSPSQEAPAVEPEAQSAAEPAAPITPEPATAPTSASAPTEPSLNSAAAQTAAVAAPQTPTSAPAADAPDPLVIQAREQTWLQVRDAQGAVLAERNLQGGERYAAQGSGPWSVVIGRADAADVTVRGQPMDLSAIARSNVARFEVK